MLIQNHVTTFTYKENSKFDFAQALFLQKVIVSSFGNPTPFYIPSMGGDERINFMPSKFPYLDRVWSSPDSSDVEACFYADWKDCGQVIIAWNSGNKVATQIALSDYKTDSCRMPGVRSIVVRRVAC